MNMSIAAMAGSSLIHNLGYLSADRTGSLEILVLCDELANSVTRLARGIEVIAETLALDVIKRAAPENTFVSDGTPMTDTLVKCGCRNSSHARPLKTFKSATKRPCERG